MSAPQCYASGIDPSAIPGDDLDPDAIEAAADGMTTDANTIRDAGADVVTQWRGLGGCYEAPEAETLFAVLDPVETNARDFADDLAAVATALRNFAADIRPIKSSLAAVRADAWDFRDSIASNDEWEYDQDLVDENTDLVRRVNALQVQLWEAERTCANAIRALYGAAPWHAMTSEDDPLGYGIDEIPTDAEMPWGSEVQRRDHCPKSAAVSVKRFVWDGVVVDGIWGTVTGLGMLVGLDGTGWHWETMRDSWVGMGSLIGYSGGEWSWGTAGQAWLGLGKGLIAYDTWGEDPARAAGGAIFNVATILIPAGAAVTGTKGAATAAGTASRVSTWLARGARIVDMTDPVALTIRGARLVLPKIDDLLVGMRGALEGLTSSIEVPDIPVTALDDVVVPGLDDLPTGGLDDLPGVHTPDLDVPTVRTPDVDVPPVRTPDVDVPAVEPPVRVPEPVRVGGPDTPTTPTTPDTPGTPGGSGQGADDLLSGPRDPNTPGTTGPDAPTGTHTTPDAPRTGGDTTPGGHTPHDGPGSGTPDTPRGGDGTTGSGTSDGTPGGSAADDAVPGPAPDGPDGPRDGDAGTPGDAPGRVVIDETGNPHVVSTSDDVLTAAHHAGDVANAPFAEALTTALERHGLTATQFDQLVTTPLENLSRADVDALLDIRRSLPGVDADTVLQKVIQPTQVLSMFPEDVARHLLGDTMYSRVHALGAKTFDTLGGFVGRAPDVLHLNPSELFAKFGLNYDSTPFVASGEPMFAVRYRAGTGLDAAVVDLPDGFTRPLVPDGPLEAMRSMPDSVYAIADPAARRQAMMQWIEGNRPDAVYDARRALDIDGTTGLPNTSTTSRNPFRGNGFGGTGADYLPEYSYGTHKIEIPEGTELWRVLPDGSQEVVGIYRDDAWARVVEPPL